MTPDAFYLPAQDDCLLAEMHLLEQQWLRDEAAQAEYQSWLASLNSTRHAKDSSCHAPEK